MAMALSDLLSELAQHAATHKQELLAHICRMAALEARDKNIPSLVLTSNVLGIWDWDAVNDVTYLDEKCADLFDVDRIAARRGLPLNDAIKAIHPEDAPRVADTILDALRKGGPYESRYRVICKGKVRNVVARGDCTLDAFGKAERLPGFVLELPAASEHGTPATGGRPWSGDAGH